MNSAKRRRAIRWARYCNHYAHIPETFLGGWALSQVIWQAGFERRYGYLHVRRQQKHRFMHGYRVDTQSDGE